MAVTAKEVAEQLNNLNQKQISAIPKSLQISVPPVFIYNVGPNRWIVPLGTFGPFTIHPCEAGKEYSRPTVIPGIVWEGVAVDMRRIEQKPWEGRDVAQDIVGIGPFKKPEQSLENWGVFIAEGQEPTKAELETARKRLEKKYSELVAEADEFYAQGPLELRNISATHRTAASALGQFDRPWMSVAKKLVECPGCGEQVNPKAAVHAGRDGCGAVLNEEQVKSLKLPGYEHIWKEEPKQKKGATA